MCALPYVSFYRTYTCASVVVITTVVKSPIPPPVPQHSSYEVLKLGCRAENTERDGDVALVRVLRDECEVVQ